MIDNAISIPRDGLKMQLKVLKGLKDKTHQGNKVTCVCYNTNDASFHNLIC